MKFSTVTVHWIFIIAFFTIWPRQPSSTKLQNQRDIIKFQIFAQYTDLLDSCGLIPGEVTKVSIFNFIMYIQRNSIFETSSPGINLWAATVSTYVLLWLLLFRIESLGGLLHHSFYFLFFCSVSIHQVGCLNNTILTWHIIYCIPNNFSTLHDRNNLKNTLPHNFKPRFWLLTFAFSLPWSISMRVVLWIGSWHTLSMCRCTSIGTKAKDTFGHNSTGVLTERALKIPSYLWLRCPTGQNLKNGRQSWIYTTEYNVNL